MRRILTGASLYLSQERELSEDNESNLFREEETSEVSATNAQMQEALRIVRRSVRYRATKFEKHYDCENYIQQLINANKQQPRLDKFFK